MKPTLIAIAAMAENRIIGRNNQLPWRLPADMKHFKALTSGHTIIMGRKTYQSIGKPLPQRRNIILTRDPHFTASGCEIANTIEQIFAMLQPAEQAFVIGGAEIYQLLMPYINQMYLTVIHQAIDGDAYFPMFDLSDWQQLSEETHQADNDNPYRYSFIQYERAT